MGVIIIRKKQKIPTLLGNPRYNDSHNVVSFDVDSLPPNMLIPFFLMASYAYYNRAMNMMPDNAFDALSGRVYREWDSIKHRHKHMVDRESCRATGVNLNEDQWPKIIIGATMDWLDRSRALAVSHRVSGLLL